MIDPRSDRQPIAGNSRPHILDGDTPQDENAPDRLVALHSPSELLGVLNRRLFEVVLIHCIVDMPKRVHFIMAHAQLRDESPRQLLPLRAFGELAQALADEQLGCAFDQALADTRDHAADLKLAVVVKRCCSGRILG